MRLSRRRRRVLLGGAAALAVVAALVLLEVPIDQESSGYQMIGTQVYAFEDESLFGPGAPRWSNVSFRGASVSFEVYCPSVGMFGQICGSATEPSGATKNFTFFEPEVAALDPPSESWVAPDGSVAAEYHPGGTARLLVVV